MSTIPVEQNGEKFMLHTKHLSLFFCVMLAITLSSQAKNKKETYFSCKNGYQFESKKTAARCIKQGRLSFRPLNTCNKKGRPSRKFKLQIDRNGIQDRCVIDTGVSKKNAQKIPIKGNKTNLSSLSIDTTLIFIPSCPSGYFLKSKRGKDNCRRGDLESITAPTRKVTL